MRTMFEGLKPLNVCELLTMIMLAVAIPFYWYAAQVMEAALVVCAVLKVVFWQKFHFNENQMRYKWFYIVIILTWIAYLIGMSYTENTSEGWTQVTKKLGFLLFPLVFLFSDMSYLTKDRIRAVFYGLVAGCVLFFLMNFVAVIVDTISNGREWDPNNFFNENLTILYFVHHTYTAMYCTLAFAFLVSEIFNETPKSLKIIDGVLAAVLALVVVLVDSRAGLLCFALIIVLLWFWVTFVLKKRKIGIIIGTSMVVFMVVLVSTVPRITYRIRQTVSDVSSERSSDHRVVQLRGYKALLKDCWLTGVGTGDRIDEIQSSYHRYKAFVVNEIQKNSNCDLPDDEFVKLREEYVDDMLNVAKEATGYEIHENLFKYLNNAKNHEVIDVASAEKILPDLQFIQYAIDKKINAHNQYFETILAIGIVGLILMIAMLVMPAVVMIRKRVFDVLFVSFLIIISLNALFESIFEIQNGIIYFNFFNVLLFTALAMNLSLCPKK